MPLSDGHRRRLSVFVEHRLMPGVCGVQAGATLPRLGWTNWSLDCSQHSNDGTPLCMRVDGDPHNDAEPWQEIEYTIYERWSLASSALFTGPSGHSHFTPSDAVHADIIVIPSALAHCRSPRGWQLYTWWNPAMVDGRTDVHRAYWSALRASDERRASARAALNISRPQWMLLHYDGNGAADATARPVIQADEAGPVHQRTYTHRPQVRGRWSTAAP